MIAVALAAASALSYGASDFSGAMATKENNATVVTLAMQVVSLAALAVIVVAVPSGQFRSEDLAWGAIGGLGAAFGLVTFYRALALGPMSVAAALTALWSTAVPVVAGLLLGDRPGPVTLAGIALAVPAAVLVSLEGGRGEAAVLAARGPKATSRRTRQLAIMAGIGFGLFFVALSRTAADAGLYPLLGARGASIAGLLLVIGRGRLLAPIGRRWWPAIGLAGLLDCAANSLYLTALRYGSLTWVAAISSLYPVSTVLLARLVLGERIAAVQRIGLAAASLALILFGLGATG